MSLICLPLHYRQFVGNDRLLKGIFDVPESFQLHRKGAFLNFVARAHPEAGGQTQRVTRRNEPLGKVPMIPTKGIPVIRPMNCACPTQDEENLQEK